MKRASQPKTRQSKTKLDLLQGTLDLMVLQTLGATSPQHGYGLARRIEEVSGDVLELNQGTIYAALIRLQQRGWIGAEWGTSENNRRAKFYRLTTAGHRALADETESWEKLCSVMDRFLNISRGSLVGENTPREAVS